MSSTEGNETTQQVIWVGDGDICDECGDLIGDFGICLGCGSDGIDYDEYEDDDYFWYED